MLFFDIWLLVFSHSRQTFHFPPPPLPRSLLPLHFHFTFDLDLDGCCVNGDLICILEEGVAVGKTGIFLFVLSILTAAVNGDDDVVG